LRDDDTHDIKPPSDQVDVHIASDKYSGATDTELYMSLRLLFLFRWKNEYPSQFSQNAPKDVYPYYTLPNFSFKYFLKAPNVYAFQKGYISIRVYIYVVG
jgi:hypothetical protein